MRLAILSGKGGVGKTTIAVALSIARNLPLIGADVESPTTMLMAGDRPTRVEKVMRKTPKIIEEKCVGCGICAESCPFGAILLIKGKAVVDSEACEGCLYCVSKCPFGAIEAEDIEVGELRYGNKVLIEGSLKPGRKESRRVLNVLLERIPSSDVIIDGSPGASPLTYRIIKHADKIIVVVEPNKPSIADASRVLELIAKIGRPAAIVINKYGIGREELVEELSRRFEVPIIGRISYRRVLMKKRPYEVPELIEEASSIVDEFAVPKAMRSFLSGLPDPPQGPHAKYIAVVSGKGGTGKTLLSIGLSRYLSVPVVDADVDAPDSWVLLGEPKRRRSLKMNVYEIDPEKCTACGECVKACYIGAIEPGEKYRIIPEICEGCGMCMEACPYDAISPVKIEYALLGVGDSYYIAESDTGRAGIGDLVYKLKQAASKFENKYVLDGAPGTGCTTIAAISGSKATIIVVEPTEESLMSASRVAKIAEFFNVPRYVVINKRDGEDIDVSQIGKLIGKIPYDEGVFEAYAEGHRPSGTKADEAIRKIAESLKFLLED